MGQSRPVRAWAYPVGVRLDVGDIDRDGKAGWSRALGARAQVRVFQADEHETGFLAYGQFSRRCECGTR